MGNVSVMIIVKYNPLNKLFIIEILSQLKQVYMPLQKYADNERSKY